MAYQNTNNKPKDPTLYHSALVKDGPKLVTVMNAPKMVKNNTLCLVELLVDGVKHVYWVDTPEIKSGFESHVGQQVVLMASGNSKQGTARMEFQLAGVPATQIAQPAQPVQPVATAPAVSQPAAFRVVAPEQKPPQQKSDRETKTFLCQAANLMRLCVKKANDIKIELGLPDEHRQGIATTLFIQADRKGFIDSMPINPYTPEELGFGASKAQNLAEAQPVNDEEEIF
jgi:hypothetical protein